MSAKWNGQEWICGCGGSWWRACVTGVATVLPDEYGEMEVVDMDVEVDGDPVCTNCQHPFAPEFEDDTEEE